MGILKIQTLLLVFISAAFAQSIPTPSDDGLRRSERRDFQRQEKILKKLGYRFGDGERNYEISNRFRNQSICEDLTISAGFLGLEKRPIYYYDYAIANSLDHMRNLPRPCQLRILNGYQDFKGRKQNDADDDCENKNCELIESARQRYIDNVDTMREIIGEEAPSLIEDELNGIGCVEPTIENPTTSSAGNLTSLAVSATQLEACADLEEGETRVTAPTDRLKDYVEQKYAITNLGDNTYSVDLVIDFKGNTPNATQAMYARADRCLEEFNQVARDGQGRKLKINIHSVSESSNLPSDKRPPTVEIQVSPGDFRQSSRHYKEEIECSTMVHEMMHLMGLHDEYHETNIGQFVNQSTGHVVPYYVPGQSGKSAAFANLEQNPNPSYQLQRAYQCRSVPQRDSLMKQHSPIYNAAVPQSYGCDCSSVANSTSKENCRQLMAYPQEARQKYLQLSASLSDTFDSYRANCTVSNFSQRVTIQSPNSFLTEKKINNFQKLNQQTIRFTNMSMSSSDFGGLLKSSHQVDCTCSPTDTNCMEMISKLENYSQQNTFPTNKCPLMAKKTEPQNLSRPDYATFTSVVDPSVNLLQTAHMEMLIHPRCESRAPKYLRCLDQAYSAVGESCMPKPAYCSDDSWLDI